MASRSVHQASETPAVCGADEKFPAAESLPGDAPRGGPKLVPGGQPLPRLRPSSRVGPRSTPPGAPGTRRRRAGGRSAGSGRRKRPRGAGAWRGPSLPHARSLPAARCGPYQVLRSEALHLARRAGGRALGALAEPAADRLGARRPTGEKGRSAAPRQPPSATDFAPCAVLSGPRAPPGPLGCSRRPARVPPHLPRGGAPRRSPKPPRGATPDLPA